MFENLSVFKIAHAMAVHAGHKQAVSAENVANSDTPGFKSRMVADFATTLNGDDWNGPVGVQKATRSRHLHGAKAEHNLQPMIDGEAIESPNGNSVSLEREMLKSLDAKRQHDRALAIYRSSLNIIRSTLART